jgi:glycosyltransferase involved in cell wall biosynthesis
VYVEAWSYGKPVVGGPAPPVLELIDHGRNGLTVQTQGPGEIAAALTRVLKGHDRGRAMGVAGQAEQRQRYTSAAVVRDHLNVFEALLERNRNGRRLRRGLYGQNDASSRAPLRENHNADER